VEASPRWIYHSHHFFVLRSMLLQSREAGEQGRKEAESNNCNKTTG
jgi:hypothetical protein